MFLAEILTVLQMERKSKEKVWGHAYSYVNCLVFVVLNKYVKHVVACI